LFKKLKNNLKDQRGLTLIELLAVIVILGIIAAIAIPSIGNVIENSKRSAIRADAMQILSAAKLYAADNGVPVDKAGTEANEAQITQAELANYVDNTTTMSTYTVTFVGNTPKLSSTGTKGGQTITFTDATVNGIDSAAKSATAISN
jgi:type IV pilus assembly protein PilA